MPGVWVYLKGGRQKMQRDLEAEEREAADLRGCGGGAHLEGTREIQ